jgi:hypothetical protein
MLNVVMPECRYAECRGTVCVWVCVLYYDIMYKCITAVKSFITSGPVEKAQLVEKADLLVEKDSSFHRFPANGAL